MEPEPLCDLLPLAFEPKDTGLQDYALPATPQQITSENLIGLEVALMRVNLINPVDALINF